MNAAGNAAGMVLCGGRSSRMGQDKNFLSWSGRSFLQQAVAAVETHCQQILLVTAGPEQLLPPVESKRLIRVISDELSQAGPARAFCTGLQFLLRSHDGTTGPWGQTMRGAGVETMASCPELVFLTGNDSPALKPALVELLLTRVASNPTIHAAVPAPERGLKSGTHPLCAAYSMRCLPAVQDYLAAGGRSMKGLLQKLHVDWVTQEELEAADPHLESLLNINSPADYRRSEARDCNTSIPRSNCSSDAANDKRK